MTLICITYANYVYSAIVVPGCIPKYGVGFLFSLVSELVFGDTCFLMSGRKVLTPFFVNSAGFRGLVGNKKEYSYVADQNRDAIKRRF